MRSRRPLHPSFHIAPLSEHRDALPTVADWIHREWSFLYAGRPRQYVEAFLRKRLHKRKLPLTLVALRKGVPVGTVSLKEFELEGRHDLQYWVTSLFVVEDARGRGIGGGLMRSVEEKAGQLGIERLYLFTADRRLAVRFYRRVGWKVSETTTYAGYEVIVMEKHVSAGAKEGNLSRAA